MIKSFRKKPQHPLVELRNHILRLRKNEDPVHGTKPLRITARNPERLETPVSRGGRHA